MVETLRALGTCVLRRLGADDGASSATPSGVAARGSAFAESPAADELTAGVLTGVAGSTA
jgi:hypothetical protein